MLGLIVPIVHPVVCVCERILRLWDSLSFPGFNEPPYFLLWCGVSLSGGNDVVL